MTVPLAVRALRGATTVDDTGTSLAEAARAATQELLRALLERNGLTADDVVSAFFTVTPDLYTAAPGGSRARSRLARGPDAHGQRGPAPSMGCPDASACCCTWRRGGRAASCVMCT